MNDVYAVVNNFFVKWSNLSFFKLEYCQIFTFPLFILLEYQIVEYILALYTDGHINLIKFWKIESQ